ncbi:MAG: fasciclin domain-containing protein [Bacteroidia bacterium]
MKNNHIFFLIFVSFFSLISACTSSESNQASATNGTEAPTGGGQSAVVDDESQKDIVKVAIGSKDHSTLVAAVKAADLVNALSNAGPFTVFAPVNAAFDKLPKGTVEDLLKPENKEKLATILQYHVSVGVFKIENIQDGQSIGQVDGGNITLHVKDGKIMVNDANVIATVPASNGIIHVIDKVLLPATK